MTDYIIRSGGEVLTDTAVTQVDSQRKQARTAGGEVFGYKKLVWAADQKTLYSSTDVGQAPQAHKQRRLAEKGQGGDSILTVFMGVDLPNDYFRSRCGDHAFYTPSIQGLSSLEGWETATSEGMMRDWAERYLDLTTYEISCPALRDPELAPDGKTGVIVSTLMDYGFVKRAYDAGRHEQFKDYCKRKVIDVLDASIFPGIADKVEFALCATPLTIERETGNAHGAITGWAFTNKELPSEGRFMKIAGSVHTPIRDVYQCGQWTFSPSGLPVSILTGKLAADAVHKALNTGGAS